MKGLWNLELLGSEQARDTFERLPFMAYGMTTIGYIDYERHLEHMVTIMRRCLADNERSIRKYTDFAAKFPNTKFDILLEYYKEDWELKCRQAHSSTSSDSSTPPF